MAITPDQVKARFPEFNLIDDARIELSILESVIIMGDDVSRWSGQEMYYMANSYLVAHLLTVSQQQLLGDDTALAPVRRTSVDNVEVDYAVTSAPSFLDTEFATTSYGKRYLMYRNMLFTGMYSI